MGCLSHIYSKNGIEAKAFFFGYRGINTEKINEITEDGKTKVK